jgi:hypothetical protein
MINMPSCNLSKTVHKKWLQQSGNCGNDLFSATYNNKIRAVMQMTNYKAYLKGKSFGSGPSRQELKLKMARHSSNPKKIVKALSQLPGVEVATTRIPHLEGEVIFGFTRALMGGSDKDELPHVTTAMEFDCDMSQ